MFDFKSGQRFDSIANPSIKGHHIEVIYSISVHVFTFPYLKQKFIPKFRQFGKVLCISWLFELFCIALPLT